MEIAQERILEIKAMAEEKKIEAMLKAQKNHDEVLVKIKESITDIEDEDSLEEIKSILSIFIKYQKTKFIQL